MEVWDVYDVNMNKINKVIHKGSKLLEGEYHLAIEVWIINNNNILLTKRSSVKTFYPNYWECTGGSVITEENVFLAAKRELYEEIGVDIEVSELIFMGNNIRKNYIVTTFILDKKILLSELKFSDEVCDAKYFTLEEVRTKFQEQDIVLFLESRFEQYIAKYIVSKKTYFNKSSLDQMLKHSQHLSKKHRGLPDVGRNFTTTDVFFNNKVQNILNGFKMYGNEIYNLDEDCKFKKSYSLGGGSPAKFKPFPLAIEYMHRELESGRLYEYPLAAGDLIYRNEVLEYLKSLHIKYSIDFKCNDIEHTELNVDNIIFTASTTQAFSLILKVIARPYDVVIMTGPTYGLFSFVPERMGCCVEILPLELEDDWLVNPIKLDVMIKNINGILQETIYDVIDYTPRVIAFLNENPHNPTGKVMGMRQINLISDIAKVCNNNGVFVIDDLIYRDLCYDTDNIALPMATFPQYFSNTITLLGLSKSFGLAGVRAGVVVANEMIVRGIRNYIFQEMDSPPVIQAAALAGVFNNKPERIKIYDDYFKELIVLYKQRFEIVRVLVEGVSTNTSANIINVIQANKLTNIDLLKGNKYISIVENMYPESGFFLLLDFTKIKKMIYDDIVINTEEDLLKFLYKEEGVKFIIGSSIAWPDKTQLIARITFALDEAELIGIFEKIAIACKRLKNE